MNSLYKPMEEMEEFLQVKERLKKQPGIIQITGCIDTQKSHMAFSLGNGFSNKIIASFSETKAREIYEDYRLYDKNVMLYPARDLIFFQSDVHGNALTRLRMSVIKAIIENQNQDISNQNISNQGITIVTTIDAFMDSLIPIEAIKASVISLKTAQIMDVKDLVKKLIMLGYEKNFQAEAPGQYSIRGGIVDIFSLTEENPYRIEFWDDEIDTIRIFDAQTQRSIENLDEVRIYPATELVADSERLSEAIEEIKRDAKKQEKIFRDAMKSEEAHRLSKTINQIIEELEESGSTATADAFINYFYKDTVTISDYFKEKELLLIIDEPVRVCEKMRLVEKEFNDSMTSRFAKGYILKKQLNLFRGMKASIARINEHKCVALSTLDGGKCELGIAFAANIPSQGVSSYNNSFEMLTKDLQKYKANGSRVVLVCPSVSRAKRLAEELREYELNSYYSEDGSIEVKPREIQIIFGNLRRGFEYPLINFVLIAESDIFGIQKTKSKKKKSFKQNAIKDFSEISPGDYVVHETHGLGIYRGIETLTIDNVTKDYIHIDYQKGDNLYILATQLDSLQKYAGSDGKKPKLSRLGGKEWSKTKSQVKAEVWQVANDLVELYAKRQERDGFEYSADTVWQQEFEETFPYEETEDQLRAIQAAKKDMESRKIMDRLVCGDVGYGKTEIAIRVAFKAVQDGKQVVYLVPTTILAQQHYNTFVQRMKDFPIRVDLLCRFRTPKEQKATIVGLKNGAVDIVIGTHRVLSKDVEYKDLGVLIIDEEQRFGVAHKEMIKKLRNNVDVLTLTATPIPRTLHMSLIGIRDMSVLEEAPVDRTPIQTFVMEYDEEMVREAISRELARGGQVFYVFNRVNNIQAVTADIASLVPEARVEYAHGKMPERQLEDIMYDFINGEIDVLVSTTIIETGMDITNVNTIIIHSADKLGLSQLYQLRGRVGRSNRTAYAYLMYSREALISEVAEKRLGAIKEFTDLGSGIKIAMRDLEIRGAGNLLGMEQSGNIAAVGYDMYCKLLNEAVMKLKGEKVQEGFETKIELDVDAFIPDRYISNELQKFDIYKRIAEITNEEEYDEMYSELMDRFGNPPKLVENLMDVAALKALAHKVYITEIAQREKYFKFTMFEQAEINGANIPKLLGAYKGSLSFKADKELFFIYTPPKTPENKKKKAIELCREVVLSMIEILVD